MRYRVLGPVRVERDGEEISLGGPQQRLVLALLIAADGRVVSSSALIEAVWSDDAPPTAKKTIQGYISKLRAELGEPLATQGNGYSLATSGAVDATEFEEMRSRAHELLDVDPTAAAALCRQALALWDGPAYADLSDQLSLAPDITRLADLRIAILGDRVDADLACGGHRGLIGELDGLTQEYPLHDRFRAQHMLALYRAGRQVEALRSFERTRRFLADEMGLDPSAELRQLEQKILGGDESLDLDGGGEHTGRAAVRGYELREAIGTADSIETYRAYQRSVGREVTVHVLGEGIADDPEFIANFVTDTQRVAALEHPHIGFVYDTWREPGRAYQVGRWFPGGSLADRLATKKISTPKALRILDQVGGALAYAHRQRVPHGQVNASSVMFDDDGNSYLRDFLVGRNSLSTIGGDRKEFAALAHLLITGAKPQLVEGELATALPISDAPLAVSSVFDVAFEPGAGYARIEDFLRALHQATGTEAATPHGAEIPSMSAVRNPYKGLRAFQETDADDFFGRDDLIERLVSRLDSNRFVAVVGPSGSGKSSAVKAGLSAQIRRREDGLIRLQTEMFPGAFPFEELEGALLRVGVNRDSVIDELLSDDRGLLRVLKQIMPADDAELLLIIDQFEELFSMATDRKVTQLFLASLLTAVSDPRSRLRVVVTMRADFYDRPLQHAKFGALVESGLVSVTMPDQVGLAAAVAQPALAVGLDFEAGLIDRIVRDLDDQSGGLPLLQYAMTELVEQRTSDVLTYAAYESIGGVYGALGKRAEDLYDALPPAGQRAIRQAFLRMVTVDEGAKDLRRRVTRAELATTDVDDTALAEALQLYGAHRLLTFDRDPTTRANTVEVAHEALTREWGRLEGWIADERDDLVVRRRVDEAVTEWETSGQDPSYLPAGSRLAQFQDWSSSTTLALSSHETDFLDAGAAREDDQKQRAANRRKRLIAGLAAVAVVMTLAAGLAFVQKQSSDQVAFDAETDRLASEAVIREVSNPQLGILLAAESFNREKSAATLGALQRTMIGVAPVVGFSDNEALQIEWELGRIFLLTDSGIDVLDSSSYQRTHRFEFEVAERLDWGFLDPARDGELIPFAASASSRWVGAATVHGAFQLFDIANEEATTVGSSNVSSAAFSRAGDMLALGYDHGGVEVFRLPGLETFVEIPPVDAASSFADIPAASHAAGRTPEYEAASFRAGAVAFDPDAAMLAVAQGPRVSIFSTSTGELLSGPIVTTSTQIGVGSGSPFLAQALWFDDSELVIKGLQTLVFVSVADGSFLFKTPLIVNRNVEDDFWPTVVRRLDSGVNFAVLPDGRLLVVETERPPDNLLSSSATFTTKSVALSEIELTSQVDEAMAVSPNGDRWIVGQEGRLVFGSLGGEQMLAKSAPRGAEGASDLIAAWALLAANDRPPLLSLSADGTIAASGALNAVLTRFDGESYSTDNGVVRGRVRFGDSGSAADHDHLVISRQPLATVIAGNDFSPIHRLSDFAGTFGISPSGTLLAYESCNPPTGPTSFNPLDCVGSDVTITDLDSGEVIEKLAIGREVEAIEWHPLDDILFVVDSAGRIEAWDSLEWTSLDSPLTKLDVEVRTLRLSPDGEFAAVVETSAAVHLVSSDSGAIIRTFGGDARFTPSLKHAENPWFSTDNSLLLTTDDGAARLWDVETAEQLGRPFPNDIEVSAGGRSGDVLELVTAVEDDLLIWNLDTTTWFGIACDAVGRNMTRAEWDQFGPRDTDYRATCPQYPIED